MLSINIPVFNVEVTDLVNQLARQATLLEIDFEIRVYDDCSDKQIKRRNSQLAKLPGVVYKEMPENLGRSAIRNKMGFDSKKDYLLFIDADSGIILKNYIENYLKYATPRCVVCGGTQYTAEKPADAKKLLRWEYGRKREAISAEQRNLRKGFIFTSNNFLIDRQVFEKYHFRDDIGPYGHEDTLLGYDLFMNGIIPYHIDNPVEHTGLENSEGFILKTQKALENLLLISEQKLAGEAGFTERVNFLNLYYNITRICPPFLIRFYFFLFKRLMEWNLTGKNPLLLFFDLYRLGYFAKLHPDKTKMPKLYGAKAFKF